MEPVTTVDFAGAARALSRLARRHGLTPPTYRCPPRLVGVDRSIRRRRDGAIVAVRLHNRPRAAVLADMIEGVVVANGLRPPDADRVRAELWNGIAATDSATSTARATTAATVAAARRAPAA